MKLIKVLAVTAALVYVSSAYAEESYAPEAKTFSLEVQFNPFSNDFTTFRMDALRGRYYFSDKDAVRVGLGFGISTKTNTPDPDDHKNNWTRTRNSNFNIELGYERNIYNYKRVNLYAGGALSFDYKSIAESRQSEVNNNNRKSTDYSGDYSFFAKAFTGVDFFIYKGLFVGAELNLKIGVTSNIRPYTKGGINDHGEWSDSYKSPKGADETSLLLNLGADPAIRLGWQF